MFAFGAVRFDRDDANSGGWAAIAGNKAQRISSHGDLDNQTLWWSNLSFKAVHTCNLHKTPNFKRTTYLNAWDTSGQSGICDSWGLNDPRFSEQVKTQFLSAIFTRTMGVAINHYGMTSDGMPLADNLADELRCLMLPDPDKSFGPEIDAALKSAHQYFCYPVTPRLVGDDFITINFQIPAVKHAKAMLECVYPSDEVKYIPSEALPPNKNGHRIKWALESERPLLLKVNVSQISPDIQNVLGFANGAKRGRQWVSQPELLQLSRYATVDITAAFMFSEYRVLSGNCSLPPFNRLQSMSPTAEIICSNHWVSLCKENPYSLEANKADQRQISPRAVWLNSMDRFFCFSYAAKLASFGITVKRYGAGSIMCVVPKYHYKEVFEAACSIGLLSPSKIISEILMQEDLNHV
ncbi:hypothetical protein U1710_02445 [Aeromonas caviae]|uniref:hypothetical protein n=1 Tax=Aeromonas TaxID=642 RepID=UPI00225A72D7|nr:MULTISPECIES: hypothetical protein [Aeromonas]MCX4116289.1 hypothetical protein [Aeromonas hydrophila]MDN6867319.1 hypothetical protein [Aeromonas caviae]